MTDRLLELMRKEKPPKEKEPVTRNIFEGNTIRHNYGTSEQF